MKIGQHQEVFLAGLLLALGAGIGCASLLTLPMGIVLSLLVMALLLSVYGCYRAQTWTWLAFVLAFFFVGFWRFMVADNLPEQDISHWAKETVKVEGTLREADRAGRKSGITQKAKRPLRGGCGPPDGKKAKESEGKFDGYY